MFRESARAVESNVEPQPVAVQKCKSEEAAKALQNELDRFRKANRKNAKVRKLDRRIKS
jgi:hypothetical protein